jgi:predicted Fe-Mo cluster-binding NifX family protein
MKNEVMKIAIPVESDHLSLYFGQCSHYEIFGVKSGEIISTGIVQPSLQETDELPEWLVSQGVSAVITCRIENDILNRLIENKINVFIEAPLKRPDDLVEDFLEGRLFSGKNPGGQFEQYEKKIIEISNHK